MHVLDQKGGGILKKPGPYGSTMEVPSLDKDKWLEENADRLSRLERLDRLSMSSQNQLNVQQVRIYTLVYLIIVQDGTNV